jgi:hypothetical protein
VNSDEPWKFRLEARLRPSPIPGAPPELVWVVHSAVKPEPGLELEFAITPVAQRSTGRKAA